MLTEISIRNFRNLSGIDIKPARFTLLIGPNGTGKSGIFHALCILKQTFEQDHYPTSLRTVGNQVNLGSRREIVLGHDDSNIIRIGLSGTFSIGNNLSPLVSSPEGKFSFKLKNEVHANSKEISTTIGSLSGSIPDSASSGSEIEFAHDGRKEGYRIDESSGLGISGSFMNQNLQPLSHYVDTFMVSTFLKTIFYVPVQRGISQFKTQISQYKPQEIITSQGTAKLTKDILETIHYDHPLIDKISKYTEQLFHKEVRPALVPHGLGDDRDETPAIKGTAEFYDSKVSAFASNSGFGLNQALFLLVQVLSCPSGSIILIEEPEISLHPVSQKELIEILVEIAKSENKQIILTSHSEHIAFSLFKLVESGQLNNDELAVYGFEQKVGDKLPSIVKIDTVVDSLRSFLGNDDELIRLYIDAMGKTGRFLTEGQI